MQLEFEFKENVPANTTASLYMTATEYSLLFNVVRKIIYGKLSLLKEKIPSPSFQYKR